MFHVKEYIRAESLEQAYKLNQKRGNVLLGGMMWLKMGSNYKTGVIDLSGLGLDQIVEETDQFSIGCMCSLRALELHEGLNRVFDGVFRECTRHIVGTQFRNTATVGGSIFGRYGFSDILTCMMMLDTWVELYHGGMVPLEEFARMPYNRDILVRVVIKKDGRKAAYASQRQAKTDFPVIACAVAKKDGRWYVSVGARPSKARLEVLPVTEEDYQTQAVRAAELFTYGDNMRAGADYRKYLAGVYVRRLMEQLGREDV
ncbi:MAG: FAD binding domain-containing protein [Eubacteriales bacterium]|nr:FAD binding domain-containing protein [Eubacteriales bacterium]